MKLNYNVTGAERKSLVGAISKELDAQSKYLGMPSAAYDVGEYRIDKTGTVTGPDNRELAESLKNVHSFTAVTEEYDEPETAETEAAETDTTTNGAPEYDKVFLQIEMPKAGFTETSIANLRKLVESKAGLIKKAVGYDSLPIEETEDTLCFPWFPVEPTSEEVKAYSQFIAALCKMAKEQKRVIAKEKEVENEKYAFRCFLLRLGFIGSEYKEARTILLANLNGNGSFKNGERRVTEAPAETHPEDIKTVPVNETEAVEGKDAA